MGVLSYLRDVIGGALFGTSVFFYAAPHAGKFFSLKEMDENVIWVFSEAISGGWRKS